MGDSIGCIQSDIIASMGQQVRNDFFSKNFFGQFVSALSASRSCDMPIGNSNLRNCMCCQFLKSQKEAYEIVFMLILAQFFCILILGAILYCKTRRVVNEIRQAVRINRNQHEMITNNTQSVICGATNQKKFAYERSSNAPKNIDLETATLWNSS